jgi:hypothetical protein
MRLSICVVIGLCFATSLLNPTWGLAQPRALSPDPAYATARDRTAPLPELVNELALLGKTVLNGTELDQKLAANEALFHRLWAILERPDSYDFGFDSLTSASRLFPEDQSFRIFTWLVRDPSDNYTYYGIVQRRIQTPEGAIYRAIPLYDKVDRTDDIEQVVLTNQGWLGALYYKPRNTDFGVLTYTGTVFQPVQRRDAEAVVLDREATYYVVMGLNQHDASTNYKILDVIHFRADSLDRVYFGLPIFYFSAVASTRRVFKYTENSVLTLNHELVDQKRFLGTRRVPMIVYDQLTAPTNRKEAATWTQGSDGTVNGLQWIDKVYDQRKGFFGIQRNVSVYDPALAKYSVRDQRKAQKARSKQQAQSGIIFSGSR